MTGQKPDERAIFSIARRLDSPEARGEYLRQVCGDDHRLFDRVAVLLRGFEDGGSFLESPAAGVAATMEGAPSTTRLGTSLGPYKIREQIAEGGMGVVYIAEQERPVRRKVALKIIKPGMDTKQVIARFEAERQALALMDHPNIAKVLDAGSTETGHPYFVMDLVRGLPMTEFCDKNRLNTKERLALFVTVCQAVQHAHQKGIIHRDIKPSNVLVTLRGDTAVPKVIDFGVAKATNQRLTERTIYTQYTQLIGTPLYMSPEQANMTDLDVDTRSDVYSLGVLLYELLTGSTPFDKEKLTGLGYDEIRRIIREDETPRASHRISTLGDRLTTISQQRSCEPRKLAQVVRGELDWIVAKALEKDRARRYESASAFAADVQRFLDNEPVQACPPSINYRFQKFARRNTAALTTAGIVALALLLGVIGTGWQAWRATRERDEKQAALAAATDEQERAEANLQLAMRAVDEIYLQSIGEERLLQSQDVAMFPADSQDAPPIKLSAQERELIQRGFVFYSQIAGQNPRSRQARFESAKALSRSALLQASLGETEKAETAFTDAISRLTELTQEDRRKPEYFVELARAYYQRGHITRWTNTNDTFVQAVLAAGQAIELNPGSVAAYRLRGKARVALTEYDEAVPDFEEVVRRDPDNATSQHDLSRLLYYMFERDRAFPYAKRAVELDPRHIGYRHHLAVTYTDESDPQSAAAVWEEALEFAADLQEEYDIRSRVSEILGDDQKTIEIVDRWVELGGNSGWMYVRRAKAHRKIGDVESALADLKKAEAFDDSAWGYVFIAREYRAHGQPDQALAAFEKAEELGPNNYGAYYFRGGLLSSLGRDREALADLDRSVELNPRFFATYQRRGAAHFRLGQYDRALADIARSLELHPQDISALTRIPAAEVARCPDPSFRRGMQELADKAIDHFTQAIAADPDKLGHWDRRAQVYSWQGRWQDAVNDLTQAIRLAIRLKSDNASYRDSRANIYAQLGQWQKALDDFAKVIESEPGAAYQQYKLALIYLQLGDVQQYQRVCTNMLEQFGETNVSDNIHWVTWTCALAPSRVDSLSACVQLAERALSSDLNSGQYRNALGAILYRAGRHEETVQQLEKLATSREGLFSSAYTWFFGAMAHHCLQEHVEARRWLSKGVEQAEQELSDENLPWNRRLTLELLRREAEQVIERDPVVNQEQRAE